ncbi:MAG: hypothetical protein ACTHJ0_14220 [Flavipsychrobacter sp.]
MKKISTNALAVGLLLFSSCSEKFHVAAPYKNITIVYGLMDMSDTAHYVRIEKAFLDDSKSAIAMAQVPDSNYFRQLNVTMRKISNGSVVDNIPLVRVDLTAEGYPKDSGTFFTTPNYAYKFKAVLDPNYTYRLVIYNPASGETDSSETAIISSDPTIFHVPIFDLLSDTISIAKTTVGNNFNLVITPPPNAAIFQAVMRFFYVDKSVIDGSEKEKYVDWIMDTEPNEGSKTFIMKIPNVEFYSFLRDAIGPPSYGIERYMDSMNLFITAATTDMYNYMIVSNAQNSGITSFEIKPVYSNIKGTSTLGLFTSRVVIKYYRMHINKESLDSLETNPITQLINIHGFKQ